MLPIKVKRHTVLSESHIVRSVLHEHVFFKVTDADRVKIRQWLGLLRGVARYRDCKHAIVLLVEQSDRTFAVALVLSLIDIFDDEHVVLDLKRVSVELLAADVADTHVDVVSALRVRDAPDELGLAVEQHKFDAALDIVEGDSAHGATMADVAFGDVDRGQRVGKPRSDKSLKLHLENSNQNIFITNYCLYQLKA